MTTDFEYTYYAEPAIQTPQRPTVRRRGELSDPVPVRLPEDILAEVRTRAEADDRSISSWVRRATERELHRPA